MRRRSRIVFLFCFHSYFKKGETSIMVFFLFIYLGCLQRSRLDGGGFTDIERTMNS